MEGFFIDRHIKVLDKLLYSERPSLLTKYFQKDKKKRQATNKCEVPLTHKGNPKKHYTEQNNLSQTILFHSLPKTF